MNETDFIKELHDDLGVIAKNDQRDMELVTSGTSRYLQGRSELAFELILRINQWKNGDVKQEVSTASDKVQKRSKARVDKHAKTRKAKQKARR
jgi:hypothetical protein